MKFYHYDQNNSGGSYDVDETAGIGVNVFIEAYDDVHSNVRAESIGIYFDGVENNMDCECCGDRWRPAYKGDAVETIEEASTYSKSGAYVHYLDGRIEKL